MTETATVQIRNRGIRTLFWIALTLGVLLTAAQTWLYFNCYEESAYAYVYGASLPTVFHIVLITVTAGLLLASVLVGCKSIRLAGLAEPNRAVTFFALLCGFFFAVSVLLWVSNAVSGLSSDLSVWRILGLILSVPASAFFLVTALSGRPLRVTAAIFGMCAVLWCIVSEFYLYMDTTMPHTSPVRRMLYVVLAGVILYLLSELRYVVNAGKPLQYLVTGITVMPLLLCGSVSNAVMVSLGYRTVGPDSVFCILLACLSAYLCCRLYLVCMGKAVLKPASFRDFQPAASVQENASAPDADVQNGRKEIL